MKFTYASLFSGIGGFEQALNKLGGTCVFASEYDPDAKTQFNQIAYEVLYGHKPHGDIRLIDEKDVPSHDIMTAGFPCQSFSVAGKRQGFDDTRGTLFFEIARIAREKQPKALLLENVKGLVNHDKGNTLDTMIRTLNEIGYVIDFEILNSKYFGVPQNRERIFIVAIREDLIGHEPFSEESTKGQTIIPKGKRRIGEWASVFNFDFPEQTEVNTRLRDVLETEVEEKYYLDDEKTAKLVAQLNSEGIHQDDPVVIDNSQSKREGSARIYRDVSPTLGARDYKEPRMVGHVDIKGHDAIKRVYSADHVGPTLTTMGGGHREPKIAQEVRACLTPFRENKRQNGPRFKPNDEPAHTLSTQDRHGVAFGSYPRYRIRKLTPLECFRLQAFPDDVHQMLVGAGISDSQRYKMAGNAVTVNVVRA